MHARRFSIANKQPEQRYQNFIIGYLRTNPALAQRHIEDLASKVGLSPQELMSWYHEARGAEKPPLSYYLRQSALDLRNQLSELGLLTSGFKKALAYRLFLANSSPERLEEQRLVAEGVQQRQKQKLSRKGQKRRMWETHPDFVNLATGDFNVFHLIWEGRGKLEARCVARGVSYEGSLVEIAIALTKLDYPDWEPHEKIGEAAAWWFGDRPNIELREKVEALYDKNPILKFVRRGKGLGRAFARSIGFDAKFDIVYILDLVKLLQRVDKEILINTFPELKFNYSTDKLVMAHTIVEATFPDDYDRKVIHVEAFYETSLRDPESVLCKIFDLGIELEPDCTFIEAINILAEKLEIKCENQEEVLELGLHSLVSHLCGHQGKLRAQVLRWYSEMAEIHYDGDSADFFSKLINGMGYPNFEATPVGEPQLDDLVEVDAVERDKREDDFPQVTEYGEIFSLPREDVVDVKADGPLAIGRVATIGPHEFEVMSCLSQEDKIYRCVAYEKVQEEISPDEPVTFQTYPFLHPRLQDVQGKSITSLGRVIEADLFSESKPLKRVIRSQFKLKEEVKIPMNRSYADKACEKGTIPTDTPTIDCLYPLIDSGIHVAIAPNNTVLKNWLESFTMRMARARPIVFGRFYPSEDTMAELGPRLRREETNPITISCSLYGDSPLAKWHVVDTSISLASQDPQNILVLANCNHINQAINKLYSCMGAASHPKLFSSSLGHVPLQIRLGEKTIKPTTTACFPAVYGIPYGRKFTSVLGVVLDELEAPFAYSMFDWASSVWILKEDEMTGRIYVCPHLSGSQAIQKEKVTCNSLQMIKACRERWELGMQLEGIQNSEFTQSQDLLLKPEHQKFLTDVYNPMVDYFEQDELRDALKIVAGLDAGTEGQFGEEAWHRLLELEREGEVDTEASQSDNENENDNDWNSVFDNITQSDTDTNNVDDNQSTKEESDDFQMDSNSEDEDEFESDEFWKDF